MNRSGLKSLMGYQAGGGVDIDSMDNQESEDITQDFSSDDILQVLNMMSSSPTQKLTTEEEFNRYRDILSQVFPTQAEPSFYDLASSLGKGLLAQQTEKFPSIGRGVGLGFQDFKKLQDDILEKNRKAKQARDLAAFGLVSKREKEVAGRGQAFYRTNDGVYREYSFPDGIYYVGKQGKLPLQEFNNLYPERELTSSTELESKLPTYLQFVEIKDKALNEELSLEQIKRYSDSIKTLTDPEKGGATGFGLLALEFTRGMKTLFGNYKDINPAEVAELLAKGQLQGLIGQFRTSVVGPGVMTEQDAARIINYFGGDVGMLTNPIAVASALKNIYKDKYKSYKSAVENYNEVPRVSIYKNFEKMNLKDIDLSIFDAEDIGIPVTAQLIDTMPDGSYKYHDSSTSTTYILDPNGGIIKKQEEIENLGNQVGDNISNLVIGQGGT